MFKVLISKELIQEWHTTCLPCERKQASTVWRICHWASEEKISVSSKKIVVQYQNVLGLQINERKIILDSSQRGAVRGFLVKRDRVYLFSLIGYYKKNIIRELWMICLSWHVKAKSYFSWIVKLDQKSSLFPWKWTCRAKESAINSVFGCSQIAWVKYVTDLIEDNKTNTISSHHRL